MPKMEPPAEDGQPTDATGRPVFAGLPRPEHPDFDLLVAIIAQGFDKEADAGASAEDVISRYVDVGSLSYMALQRAIRAMGVSSAQVLFDRMDDALRMSSLYMEAFTAGVEFERRRSPK